MVTQNVNLPSTNSVTILNDYDPNKEKLFSFVADDIVSEVVQGGSPLMNWIPSSPANQGVEGGDNVWNINFTHMQWVAGEGFDGSQSYLEYITDGFTSTGVAECDYGEGGLDFQRVEAVQKMHHISTSNKNNTINVLMGGGVRHWEKERKLRYRGLNAGLPITTDAEWILAGLALDMEYHLNWNLINGNASIPSKKGMSNGLDQVISKGYIASRIHGEGSPAWTDPNIVSMTNYSGNKTKIGSILRLIEWHFYRLLNRNASRGNPYQFGEVVLVLPEPFWREFKRWIAAGYLNYEDVPGIEFQMTPEVFQRQMDSLNSSGNGQYDGAIPFHRGNLAVITENNLGTNSMTVGNLPSVTGDMYLLQRTFRGENILEQKYLNWNALPLAVRNPGGEPGIILQNGLFRAAWVDVNKKCWYYGMEAYMGLISRMQPFQTKFVDLTLEVDFANDIEGDTFTHQNFYAFEGETGGQGVSLLTPANS